jgi:succinoglycan biosynthesis protein ExoM
MTARLVLVGVCTFRRPSLALTLDGLTRQAAPPGLSFRVAVADNDEAPSAGPLVAAARAQGLDVEHLHAPARNISVARNRVLDRAEEVGADLVAFLDDDEEVGPGWLGALVAALDAGGADAAFGPVRGRYGPGAPPWMRAAGLHDAQPETDAAGQVRHGYSGNALLDPAAPAFRGRRFDPGLGRTGGEDTAFFEGARRAGARLVPAPDAIAEEDVPDERARWGWLARRRFRMGQTHAGLIGGGAGPARRAALALPAAAKAVACLGLAALRAPSAPARNAALLRGCLHAGVLAGLLGARTLILYGGPDSTSPSAAPAGLTARPPGKDRA